MTSDLLEPLRKVLKQAGGQGDPAALEALAECERRLATVRQSVADIVSEMQTDDPRELAVRLLSARGAAAGAALRRDLEEIMTSADAATQARLRGLIESHAGALGGAPAKKSAAEAMAS